MNRAEQAEITFRQRLSLRNSISDTKNDGLPRCLIRNPIKAFTLAEVLITLAVIGVVAAFTIPVLVANYQKTQYITALKKVYVEWNQALVQMAADKNCVGNLLCTGVFEDSTNVGNEIVKYFKVLKNCGATGTSGCFTPSVKYRYDGGNEEFSVDQGYSFTTADGMNMAINSSSLNNIANRGSDISGVVNCSLDFSHGITGEMKQVCGTLMVDINGYKQPNTFGRDVFGFYIVNGKGPALYPFGGDDSYDSDDGYMGPTSDDGVQMSGNCNPNGTKIGVYCTARIIKEGWKMNY